MWKVPGKIKKGEYLAHIRMGKNLASIKEMKELQRKTSKQKSEISGYQKLLK